MARLGLTRRALPLRGRDRARRRTVFLVLLLAAPPVAADNLAVRLARLGPRPVGSAAHAAAAELAVEALRDVGLRSVEARLMVVPAAAADQAGLAEGLVAEVLAEVPADSGAASPHLAPGEARGDSPGPSSAHKSLNLFNITGVLPGRGEGEILLTAHYDTVRDSPGAGDDASGCGAVASAIADLARTPLRRTVRVVLFDGEEAGLLGSEGWVGALSASERDAILAVINVEGVGWAGTAGATVHSFPVRRGGERRLAPGWLVHATMRGAASTGLRLSMADPWISLPAQLLVRSNRLRFGADSDSFLAAGIPALFVSDLSFVAFDPAYHRPADVDSRIDSERLARWSAAVAGIVRRLDGLAGRPIDEDQYLVACGRVWLRRDLLWGCFAVWVALALVSWRRRRPAAAGRPDVVSLVFRTLFLIAALALPVFASTLLVPPAVLSVLTPRRASSQRMLVAIGLLPMVGLIGLAAYATRLGYLRGWALGLPATLLLAATLAAFAVLVLRRSPA